MARKRTRKQKQEARHPFLLRWEPEKNSSQPGYVKREFKKTQTRHSIRITDPKKSVETATLLNWSRIRHDIIKSILLASFIFGLELVLYLALS